MDRLLKFLPAIILLANPVASAQDGPSNQKFTAGVDLSYINASGLPSWTEGSVGKLRFDDINDGFVISRAFIDYRARVLDTISLHTMADLYNDDLGATVDFTEAFLEWRPVPRSPTKYRVKLGAFYPRLSLENVDPGWGSPYTMSSSAINTWVAEELRTFGAELSVSKRPEFLGGAHQVGLQVAVFMANDPTGAMLAWKGWSAHDRQSRFGDELPLPPLPTIQPGELFENQDPYVAPFREVDNRPGYYVGGEWRIGERMLFRATHYDNLADPTSFENGQYAWTTRFDHLGAQFSLPAGFGLITQWMRGSTVMGGVVNGAHMVDVEFESKFLLLTKALDKHRFSLRYDNFDIAQNDATDEDNNPENGHVWTTAYRYAWSDRVSLGAEWLSIKSHRCAFAYYGLDHTATEKQLQLSIILRFSN